MKKHRFLLLLFLTTILLASCEKPQSKKAPQKMFLTLNHYKITNISNLKGKATKGSTVIFEPKNKNNDIERIKADKEDGSFYEYALVPGEYKVHATLHGKKSPYKKVVVSNYTAEHADSVTMNDVDANQTSSESASESSKVSSAAKSEYASISESIEKSDNESATKSSYNSRYKKVSLTAFTENTSAYDGKDIQTSGTVEYIQKNPADSTMYYVVIVPNDEYDSSGYSTGHGSVTEIDVDTMKDKNIHEGDTITVRGGGLQDTVKLNGKRLNSDIIVDNVSK